MAPARKLLLTLAIPVAVLVGGAGVGMVVAAERPYTPPTGERAFESAPSPTLRSGLALSNDSASRVKGSKKEIAKLKRKCRKKTGPARQKCFKKIRKQSVKPRLMPVAKANALAEADAERIWEEDIGGYVWDDFGTSGDCRRLARNSVSCAVYVYYEETDYSSDDYGSIYTCEWLVTSSYLSARKLSVESGFATRDCYWE
jgi:hypothetical protein